MDPTQAAVYATAHDELQDLFREIARHGHVSATELQHLVLPYTAGDARHDLQELIDELKRKRLTLDEPEFIRLLWKKMYVSNVVYTTRQRGDAGCPHSAPLGARPPGQAAEDAEAINIPFAHVIVSIKRRSQLKQFAHYYASRGISGADHLKAENDGEMAALTSRTPRHLLKKRREALAAAHALTQSVVGLRERAWEMSDVVACVYDSGALCMKTHTLFTGVQHAVITNGSRLHCFFQSKTTGRHAVTSRHFLERLQAQASRLRRNEETERPPDGMISQPSEQTPHVLLTKLDDVGLRNVVAMGVGRGVFTVTTERRVYTWDAFASREKAASSDSPTAKQPQPEDDTGEDELTAFCEDEGGCFGLAGSTRLQQRVKSVAEVPGIKRIVCGDRFTIGIAANNTELYGWGSAPLGRHKTTPTRLPFAIDATIQRIACGLRHVLVLTSAGGVLSWGSNVHGQLGRGGQSSVLDAHLIEPAVVTVPSIAAASPQIVDLACGDHHSVLLSDKGHVFAFGNNWHGQLGMDPNATETGCVFEPRRVKWTIPAPDTSELGLKKPQAAPRTYLISAMGDTTAAVTEKGGVFVWGQCVPPEPCAGVCGLVSRSRPQRLALLDEDTAQTEEGDDTDPTHDTTVSPWGGIAIANGLVLLTKQS
ncbi:hypothetical protein Poli38472_009734 [Pythium oligandrum]|uniref:Uncharacterized protein n=1 Tax=Pythium oligandrum TaxID=41045 RepID=A0A8K1CF17_PYTOL|nr:hypothetical protein Poli38472_009734 [Pythium oligandrum]|eukprot:TMW62241.1 hypothetical protein Poli38472_009734 [Pythium oligandrum]